MFSFLKRLFYSKAQDQEPDPIEQSRALRAQYPSEGLVCTLTVKTPGSATLVLTVSNPTEQTQQFCQYHTPFEGIANDILRVVDAHGQELDYRGMMKKRAPPTESDYVQLNPKLERSVSFDPSLPYGMDASGRYTVQFKGSGISGLPDSNEVGVIID